MEVKILNGIKIEVKKNTVVAFVGASGCGKSSIISLIERFYDPLEGSLLYNDIDLRDVDNTWYH
jgi:ATP-binding cassette subfamily B (MDR/TAP) protein 1